MNYYLINVIFIQGNIMKNYKIAVAGTGYTGHFNAEPIPTIHTSPSFGVL